MQERGATCAWVLQTPKRQQGQRVPWRRSGVGQQKRLEDDVVREDSFFVSCGVPVAALRLRLRYKETDPISDADTRGGNVELPVREYRGW